MLRQRCIQNVESALTFMRWNPPKPDHLVLQHSPTQKTYGILGLYRVRSTQCGSAQRGESRRHAVFIGKWDRIYKKLPGTSILFLSSVLLSSPFFFSLPLNRDSNPRSHSRPFSPLPTTVRAFHFHREKTSALSSFVDSRLIAPTHAMMGDLSSSSFYLHINLQPHHDGNRTPANAVINNSIRGPLLLQHPGVCLYKNTPWTIDNRQQTIDDSPIVY